MRRLLLDCSFAHCAHAVADDARQAPPLVLTASEPSFHGSRCNVERRPRASVFPLKVDRSVLSARTPSTNHWDRDIRHRNTLASVTVFVATSAPRLMHGRDRTLDTPVGDAS